MQISKYYSLVLFGCLLMSLTFSGCTEKREELTKPAERQGAAEKEISAKEPGFDNSLPGEEGMMNCFFGYLKAIQDAHLSSKAIAFVRKYATKTETSRVSIFINTDIDRDLAMLIKLNKMNIEKVSMHEKFSYIDSEENWDYQYINIKTGKPAEPVREMRYKIRYVMVREEGKWLVSKIDEREKTKYGDYSPPRWKLE